MIEKVLPQVKNSAGFIEEFDKKHIIDEITKDSDFAKTIYGDSYLPITEENIKKIATRVTAIIKKIEYEPDDIISTDTIRGLVVTELLKLKEHQMADVTNVIGLKYSDIYNIWWGNAFADNANINGKAPEAMDKFIAGMVSKKAIDISIPEDIMMAHLTGRIHNHDADYFATRPFCNEHDARFYFYYGLYADGVGDTVPVAVPAKHGQVAILHAAKALGSAQQFFSGGQGHQNFLTFVAPYLEGMPYGEIKQYMQMYIWEMSQMLSRGNQACFSTTQLTPGVPDIWKDKPCVYSGKVWDGIQAPRRNYGEFEREVRLAFKAYTEVMLHGDAFGRPFSFPKYEIELLSEHFDPETWEDTLLHPDYSRKLEKHDTEHKNYAALSEYVLAPSYKELWMDVCRLIVRDGTPYIHNSLNLKKGTVSCYSCCAYNFESNNQTDKDFDDKMNFKNGKHFILGSLQVVTLNLPQAAYEGKTFEGFMNHVNESISMAIKLFKIKKEHISKQSLLFARQTPTDPNNPELRAPPLWDEKDLPCAIGIVGLNEAVQVLTGKQIHEDPTSHKMAIKLLIYIQFAVRDASKKHDIKLAFARTPAETTAQRFAICDLINPKYSDIAKKIIKGDVEYALDNINETKDLPIFYTNGAMVADGANIPLFEKIRLEEHAFSSFDGGNILHIWMGEKSPDPAGILSFITHLVQNTNIKYFTFTKDYSICKNCNTMIPGLVDQCHICKSDDITQFSRVTGYIQAVSGKNISGWNAAKRKELNMRTRYTI